MKKYFLAVLVEKQRDVAANLDSVIANQTVPSLSTRPLHSTGITRNVIAVSV